jgi:predicted PurR-regulated permease PerM
VPDRLRFTPFSLVRAAVIVAAGLVVLRALVAAGTVVWWLAIGTVVAAALLPSVAVLERYLPRPAAIILVIVVLFGIFGLVGYRGWAELSTQFDTLQTNAVNAATDIQESDQFGQVAREFGLVDKTRQFFSSMPVAVGGGSDAAAAVQNAASSGGALFSISMFALLMLIFAPQFVRSGLNQIDDVAVRERVSELMIRAYHQTARYSWLMVARAVVIGVIGGLACLALGLETPTALGVMFALFSFVPGLGIVLATLPIAVFEAIQSVPTAVVLILSAIIVQALEVAFVQRRIDDASVHVGPAATIVAALLGLQLYGIGGALVAMAATVYGLAMLRGLTHAHDEVFTAMRELVGDEDEEIAAMTGRDVPDPSGAPGPAAGEVPERSGAPEPAT